MNKYIQLFCVVAALAMPLAGQAQNSTVLKQARLDVSTAKKAVIDAKKNKDMALTAKKMMLKTMKNTCSKDKKSKPCKNARKNHKKNKLTLKEASKNLREARNDLKEAKHSLKALNISSTNTKAASTSNTKDINKKSEEWVNVNPQLKNNEINPDKHSTEPSFTVNNQNKKQSDTVVIIDK